MRVICIFYEQNPSVSYLIDVCILFIQQYFAYIITVSQFLVKGINLAALVSLLFRSSWPRFVQMTGLKCAVILFVLENWMGFEGIPKSKSSR